MSKTFCPLPWINVSVDTDGSVKPCCISTDYIKNNKGEKFNLGQTSIDEFYNSSDFVEIRHKMLTGQEVKGCEQCYQQEKSGGRSQRMIYNSIWPLKLNFKEKVDKIKIKYFDLRFGNLCNLKCRSCHPLASTQLQKEVTEIGSSIQKYLPSLPDNFNNWYNTPVANDNILDNLENLELLYLAGGEPSINEKVYELLQTLIKENRQNQVSIKISTNLTNTNKDFYELLANFKNVILLVSIDGYGDIQEYLRYPSKWKQIDNNIKSLEHYNFKIIVTPVIQITNFNKIVDLFTYLDNLNKKIEIDPIILESPDYLNLKYLPLNFKKSSWEKVERYIKNTKKQNSNFLQKMNSLEYKSKENFDNHEGQQKLKEYINYNTIFDKHRNIFLQNVNSELYNIL